MGKMLRNNADYCKEEYVTHLGDGVRLLTVHGQRATRVLASLGYACHYTGFLCNYVTLSIHRRNRSVREHLPLP